MTSIKEFGRDFTDCIIKFLSSNKFLYLTLLIFALQALWIAVSFRYPMIFDEWYHLNVIDFFTHHVSPFVTSQDPQYDAYGHMSFSNASLFHYLMSFPYRVITFISSSFQAQVVFLRIINVVMATFGLYIFAILIQSIGIKKIYANLAILFYSLIPLSTLVAATISYDNLLLPLTALTLLFGVKIIRANRPDITNYALFLIAGMSASLVKFTFLPIFAAAITYILLVSLRKSRGVKPLYNDIYGSAIRLSRPLLTSLLVAFMATSILFGFRFGYAVVKYHSPLPDCTQIMGYDRCMKNPVFGIIENAQQTKQERTSMPLTKYIFKWSEAMLDWFDASVSPTSSIDEKISRKTMSSGLEEGHRLPVFANLIAIATVIGIVIMIYVWRTVAFKPGWNFIIVCILSLIFTTFIFNLISYRQTNFDLNTQGRYLLNILPVFMAISLYCTSILLGNNRGVKVSLFLVVFALSTQGGGAINHLLSSNNTWYWPNSSMVRINDSAKQYIAPYVKEK